MKATQGKGRLSLCCCCRREERGAEAEEAREEGADAERGESGRRVEATMDLWRVITDEVVAAKEKGGVGRGEGGGGRGEDGAGSGTGSRLYCEEEGCRTIA